MDIYTYIHSSNKSQKLMTWFICHEMTIFCPWKLAYLKKKNNEKLFIFSFKSPNFFGMRSFHHYYCIDWIINPQQTKDNLVIDGFITICDKAKICFSPPTSPYWLSFGWKAPCAQITVGCSTDFGLVISVNITIIIMH